MPDRLKRGPFAPPAKRPASVRAIENFTRVRLSRHFFVRDLLFSGIAAHHGLPNMPDDPKLFVAAGGRLCEELLNPLVETFGSVAVRSAYRSPELDRIGNERYGSCVANEADRASHIFDRRDANGHMGATVSVVIPWFTERYVLGRDWRDLAYFIHDHLPYGTLQFFQKLAAFNITWHEVPRRRIYGFMPTSMVLVRAGAEPDERIEVRRRRYTDFPRFRGLHLPPPDETGSHRLEKPLR